MYPELNKVEPYFLESKTLALLYSINNFPKYHFVKNHTKFIRIKSKSGKKKKKKKLAAI